MTTTLFTILIIIASVALAFFILVQNPKGGGLSGSFGTLGSQVMGVKQSNDVMEKGTWTTMGIIVVLCIAGVAGYPKVKRASNTPAPTQQSAPATPAPAGPAPAAPAGPAPAPAPAQ